MKVNVIETSSTSRTLEITVADERIKEEIEQGFKRAASQANIPGFRKGKIPRDILEKKFRPTVEQEVIDKIVPETLFEAVKEHKLNIVGQPKVEGLEGGIPPLSFTAVVEIKPEFELKDLSGLKLVGPSDKVEDKEIQEQLDALLKRNATAGLTLDRKAALGDKAFIDFLGKLDGEPFDGGKAEDYALDLGSNSFIPGFEDGIVGMKTGEEKVIKVKFPDDYQAENLKGKNVEFEVKLKELKELELPKADDAFAATVGDFKTLDELKVRITESIQEQKSQNRKNAIAGQAEEQIAKKHKFDLPQSMIENEIRLLIDRQAMNLRQQGMEFKDDEENRKDLSEKARPAAEHRTRVRIVLEKIALTEKFEIGHEELHKEIHKLAPGMGLNAEQAVSWFHEGGREDGLRQQLMEQKALQWVMDKAIVKDAG